MAQHNEIEQATKSRLEYWKDLTNYLFGLIGVLVIVVNFINGKPDIHFDTDSASAYMLRPNKYNYSFEIFGKNVNKPVVETLIYVKNSGAKNVTLNDLRGDKDIQVSFFGDIMGWKIESLYGVVEDIDVNSDDKIMKIKFKTFDAESYFIYRVIWTPEDIRIVEPSINIVGESGKSLTEITGNQIARYALAVVFVILTCVGAFMVWDRVVDKVMTIKYVAFPLFAISSIITLGLAYITISYGYDFIVGSKPNVFANYKKTFANDPRWDHLN